MTNTVKPSKPPFIKQETPDSCVPACLRMIFAGYGLSVSERELRELCDCTFMGTDALQTVRVAHQYGFLNSAKHTLTINELSAIVSDGNLPIAFLELSLVNGGYAPHAVIVLDVTPFSIAVIDPDVGERLIPREAFLVAWKWRHNLAILVLP